MRSTYVRAAGLAAAVVVAVFVARASAASTAVEGLVADAAVTNAAPSLHWNTFNGAVSYRIARNGTYLDSVTATSFTDSALRLGGVYTYRVRGVRADGTYTDPASVDVTYDLGAPASITTKLGGDRLTDGHPTVVWPTVADRGPSGIKQYNIRRDGVFIAAVPADKLSYTDTHVGEGQYTYIVRAEDHAGNKAVAFSPEHVVTVDTTAPDAPKGMAAVVVTGTVELTWQPASDESGIRGYRVLRDGQPVGEVTTTSFTDSPGSGSHGYTVIAIDAAGNESKPSNAVNASIAPAGGSSGVPTGVSLVTGNDQSAAMKTKWPEAKIISVTLRWSQLEPSRGTFDWGNLDASLRDAGARNYKVIVRILCGFNAPAWIYTDPNDPVRSAYVVPTDDGYRLTTGVNVPVPWDPDLLVHYKQMMSAVAQHLQGSDGRGGTLADHVFMIPVAMATAFGSEMVENFGQGTWAGTYNGQFKSAWDRRAVNTAVWLDLAPGGSTTAEKLAALQRADTQAWLNSIDAQEAILQPTGIMSSVAYGFAFNSFAPAQAVEAAEVPKYKGRLMTMFTNLQPKVNGNGTLGPWGSWCPACDALMKSAIADGGPVGFQTAVAMMNTKAKVEYATDSAIATYHPRFIETVGCVINTDYDYFFRSDPNVQLRLDALAAG
jgi:hypothetical protein